MKTNKNDIFLYRLKTVYRKIIMIGKRTKIVEMASMPIDNKRTIESPPKSQFISNPYYLPSYAMILSVLF